MKRALRGPGPSSVQRKLLRRNAHRYGIKWRNGSGRRGCIGEICRAIRRRVFVASSSCRYLIHCAIERAGRCRIVSRQARVFF